MTDPDTDNKSNNGAENEKQAMDDTVNVPMDDIDESKAQLINANGGAGDHPEVAIVDGTEKSDVSFNGLGKDEVMQYANDIFWVRLRWTLFILFWVGWVAMLVTAIAIIALAPRCPPRPDMKWYQKETVYQAYSKSFKDSDKDGFGDFNGLKDKFDYITDDLGSNALYLSSVLKTDATVDSAERDLAILDHKDLDDKFGTTVAKFKSWIKDLQKKGKKVILDLIPNQTSKKHEWFTKSAAGDKDYKDYYIWAGKQGTVPNDWKNMYGDSAWEYDDTRKQYYYHSRSKDLPDLNLRNEAVQKEIKDIMKFWFGAGVGGFNVQDLEYLFENEDVSVGDDSEQSQTRHYEGTFEFLEQLRAVSDSYSDKPGRERFLFSNIGDDASENQTMTYFGDDDNKGLNLIMQAVNFGTSCDASCLSSWIGDLSDDRKQWSGLQLGNSFTSRFASKVSTAANPKNFVKMAQAMQMLLPGTPFNYYGDEFGQKNGNEPVLANNKFNPLNARTPMQWTGEENAGFTDPGVTPWVGLGQDYEKINLRVSRSHFNDESILGSFQKLITLRQKESFQWGKVKACAANKDTLLFTRKAERFPYFLTLVNVGTSSYSPHLPSLDCVDSKKEGTVVFHSRDNDKVDEVLDLDQAITLRPGDIIVIEFAADD